MPLPAVWLPWAIAGGALLVGGAIGALRAYLELKRRDAIRKLARSMGCAYEPSDASLRSEISGIELLHKGERHSCVNVLRGESRTGEPFLFFDYIYKTGRGKNETTSRQSVAAFCREGRGLPRFRLCPEGILAKIGAAFGYQDMDFKEFPRFSRAYLLRGKDEAAVRRLFRPFALEYLESNPGWWVEGGGDWLAAYKHDRLVEPSRIAAFLEDARALNVVFRPHP